MDHINININSSNQIDYLTLQKMAFLYNALQDGWSICKNKEKYIFTKKHENNKEVFLFNFKLSVFCLENWGFPGNFEFLFSITTVFLDLDLACSILLNVFFELPDIDNFNFFFLHSPSLNLYKLYLLLT